MRGPPAACRHPGSSTSSSAAVRVASSRVSAGIRSSSASSYGPTRSRSGSRSKCSTARRASVTRSMCSEPTQCSVPVTSRSSARQISSPASVASTGVARRLMPGIVPDRELAPGAQRVDDRRDEVAEARVLLARRVRPGAMDALHAGDPRDRSAVLEHDQLGRGLQEAVRVDRVRRLVLGRRALRAVEHPVGGDEHDVGAGRARSCGSPRRSRPTRGGGRTAGLPGRSRSPRGRSRRPSAGPAQRDRARRGRARARRSARAARARGWSRRSRTRR